MADENQLHNDRDMYSGFVCIVNSKVVEYWAILDLGKGPFISFYQHKNTNYANNIPYNAINISQFNKVQKAYTNKPTKLLIIILSNSSGRFKKLMLGFKEKKDHTKMLEMLVKIFDSYNKKDSNNDTQFNDNNIIYYGNALINKQYP
eukprot:351857_1